MGGTRFTACRGGTDLGYVEVDTAISGPGRILGRPDWADVGNLHVVPEHRRRGIGSCLLGEAGDWLRLARVPRLFDYCAPDDAGYRAFLERCGFRLLTRTAREWDLR